MDKTTLNYYEFNKDRYKKSTQNLKFTHIQDLFLSYIPSNSKILDFGCGTGRDTKYFLDKGYNVDAIDGSKAMCEIASTYCKINVKNILFEEFNSFEEYNGIWACSSLLHIPFNNLNSLFLKLHKALKVKGILYASFKLGTFEGFRANRYFTDLTDEKVMLIPSIANNFIIIKSLETQDIRPNRKNEKWLNLILQKK